MAAALRRAEKAPAAEAYSPRPRVAVIRDIGNEPDAVEDFADADPAPELVVNGQGGTAPVEATAGAG